MILFSFLKRLALGSLLLFAGAYPAASATVQENLAWEYDQAFFLDNLTPNTRVGTFLTVQTDDNWQTIRIEGRVRSHVAGKRSELFFFPLTDVAFAYQDTSSNVIDCLYDGTSICAFGGNNTQFGFTLSSTTSGASLFSENQGFTLSLWQLFFGNEMINYYDISFADPSVNYYAFDLGDASAVPIPATAFLMGSAIVPIVISARRSARNKRRHSQ